MAAKASIEELQAVQKKIAEMKAAHPEACRAVADFLKASRRVGYKNICKLFTEEATPESLKEEDGRGRGD